MALVLSLKSGKAFYANGQRVEVVELHGDNRFTLMGPDGRLHLITDDEAVEVLPELMVSAGLSVDNVHARVTITAPRSIKILRDDRYEEENDAEKLSGDGRGGGGGKAGRHSRG